MKKQFLNLVIVLITTLAFSQNPKFESITFKEEYTISQRDAMSLGANDHRIIYVVDTGVNELQIWDGDSWETVGGSNKTQTVTIDAATYTLQETNILRFKQHLIASGQTDVTITIPELSYSLGANEVIYIFIYHEGIGDVTIEAGTNVTFSTTVFSDKNIVLYSDTDNTWKIKETGSGGLSNPLTEDLYTGGYAVNSNGDLIFNIDKDSNGSTSAFSVLTNNGVKNLFNITENGETSFGADDSDWVRLRLYGGSGDERSGLFLYNPSSWDTEINDYSFTSLNGNLILTANGGSNGSSTPVLTVNRNTLQTGFGNYEFPRQDGTAGQVLTTDGSGQVTFEDASGGTTNYVNITDYSVVGDGSDETTEIAAAITAIPEGSTVYFPSGTYATDSSIIINKRLTIIGNGVDTVFKTFTAENEMGVDTGVIKITADNVSIYNIAIDGNYTISSGGGVDRNAGLYIDAGVNYTIVKNFTSYNTPRQGLCVVGENGIYENITIYDTARHNISVGDGINTVNAAKNNYFRNITCLGGEESAFEVNDGCENIYIDGFNFSGTFGEASISIKTHDRLNETNKNITFQNGSVTSNIGCVSVMSASTTEANEDIKFLNVDFVGAGFLIDTHQITRGLTIENCSVKSTGTKIRVQGTASNILIKNLTVKDYTNGAIVNIVGSSSVDIKNVTVDNVIFNDAWDGGNAQLQFNYIDGLSIKNVVLKPTTSTTGDAFQIQNSHNVLLQSSKSSNYSIRNVYVNASENVLIDGCDFTDSGANSIVCNSTSDLTVRKTKISGATDNGIDTTSCTNVVVDNTEITDCDYGIFSNSDTGFKIVNGTKIHANNNVSGAEFDATNNIIIANSDIFNNYRHGIRILGGSFVNMNNNQIYNNNTSEVGGSGLQLRTDGADIENIQITNNNIYDDQVTATQDYAIDYRVDAGTLTNIIITGNMLKDAFNATFTPSATVIVDNNVEY